MPAVSQVSPPRPDDHFKRVWLKKYQSNDAMHKRPDRAKEWEKYLDPSGTRSFQHVDHCLDPSFPSNLVKRFKFEQWRPDTGGQNAQFWSQLQRMKPKCKFGAKNCGDLCSVKLFRHYYMIQGISCWRAEQAGRVTIFANFDFSDSGDTVRPNSCLSCAMAARGSCQFQGICKLKITYSDGEVTVVEEPQTGDKADAEKSARDVYLAAKENPSNLTKGGRIAVLEKKVRDLEAENEQLNGELAEIKEDVKEIREEWEKRKKSRHVVTLLHYSYQPSA